MLIMKRRNKNSSKKALKNIRKKRRLSMIAVVLLICLLLGVLATALLNIFVIAKADDYIISAKEAAGIDADCIIVLGALVYSEDVLSDILQDRVDIAVSLYKSGASDRILMSGDNSRVGYNEGFAMAKSAIEQGVEAECLFEDDAGFSTYETMYRARDVFQAKKVIIVTQGFHISRAVYLARSLGLEAYGVTSDLHEYTSENYNNIRETGARVKAVFTAIFKPEPTYLGETIPISGKGNVADKIT